MVASINPQKNPKINAVDDTLIRPPLLPSEKGNDINPKKPKIRQVSSRYLSSSSPSPSSEVSISSFSRRSPSPLVSRSFSTTLSAPKRSVSADRRRSFRQDLDSNISNAGEVLGTTKHLVTSTRRLSVSFQGEAISIPVSKTKVAPAPPSLSNVRKGTPERRRGDSPLRGKCDGGGNQVENVKPIEKHMWPARSRQGSSLLRNLDYSNEGNREVIGSGNVIWALQESMNGESGRVSVDGRLTLDLGNAELIETIDQALDGSSVNDSSAPSDRTTSDTDSVSSGSTSGVQDSNVVTRAGPTGVVVSARFWKETNSQLRRLQDPSSPVSMSPTPKLVVAPKFIQSKNFPSASLLSSPCRKASPIRGGIRSASPGKLMASVAPSRGMISPSRARQSISEIFNFCETPSVLSFAVDVRRGKGAENHLVDAHLLRLLHNRQLQWLFVNARTEATLVVQKHGAEKKLWNAWITISDLRDSVTKRRYRLQLLKQKLKLASILKGQIACLEDWASFDRGHCLSLLGAIEALKASTLRLPVAGAIADIQSLKEAISSALDVIQAMASSTCSLLSKVEELNCLIAELANVIGKEQKLLEQCKDCLCVLLDLQVKHCSLRTHMLQNNILPSS